MTKGKFIAGQYRERFLDRSSLDEDDDSAGGLLLLLRLLCRLDDDL